MGNPGFSIPTMKAILESQHDIIGVVSNPPKPMGRGRKLKSTAVGEFAKDNNLNLIEPTSLKSPDLHQSLTKLSPDIFVIVAYRILPKSLINLPKFGAVNLHASLLPKYRGAGPIQWSLINGDQVSGVTIFQLKPKVDTGDILMQKEIPINKNDDMMSLGMKLCISGADLLVETLDKLEKGTITPLKQNHEKATPAPKITKAMTQINWTSPARKIHNWIRGLSPRPGMATMFKGKNFRIYKSTTIDYPSEIPGQIIKVNSGELVVATGDGALSLLEVQAEGKRKMCIEDFLRGATINIGDTLGI